MRVKTSELIGRALDWAVAKCEGRPYPDNAERYLGAPYYKPSTEWAFGGPIIEREKIATCPDSNYQLRGGRWSAVDWGGNLVEFGSAPLIAAMRCYVASKLGDEVDVPEELLS